MRRWNSGVLNPLLTAVLAVSVLTPMAHAQGPAGTFGALPPESFGGSGIPTDAVMISTFGGVTLGISATQRYSSPALSNDRAGTFFAQPGYTVKSDLSLDPGRSTWNFSFYIGGTGIANYSYQLLYDMDPAAGNGGHGVFAPTLFWIGLGTVQESQNLGFPYLGVTGNYSGAVDVTAPSFTAFNPNAGGRYTFALQQFNDAGAMVNDVGMAVEVVPEPASMTLLATGLVGLAAAARRRKANQS